MQRRLGSSLLFATLLAGCAVGPDYHRPNAALPLTYKENPAPPAGWNYARPADGHGGGAWWTVFDDPELDRLEARVDLDNQTIRQSEAAYREARALVAEARSGLFPTIGGNGGVSRARQGLFTTSSATTEATASWDLDVWGRIRRGIESNRAGAQASAADLANARLSEQALLATTYFDLCYQDALTTLLQQTVAAYRRSVDITANQVAFGVAAPSDVLTARAQLDSAQSQLVSAGIARAQYEHAIAVLIGLPPVDLRIGGKLLPAHPPEIPVSLPSTLLQRRPDIAAAERRMQQQNAQVGVNIAAFYPDLSLSAAFGYTGSPISMLYNAGTELWSLGANLTQTLSEGGLRSAQVDAARAAYDQSVASYRQTVLTALQQVEDNLSGLRILGQQQDVQARADADAQRALEIATNEYQAGTQAYTTVISEQTLLLSNQETTLQIALNRLADTVALAQALGGGWSGIGGPADPS